MMASDPKSVVLFGATGTIGRATAQALSDAGQKVTCIVRPETSVTSWPDGVTALPLSLSDLSPEHLRGADAVISCLASRTGAPQDAWAIDHDAHVRILAAAKSAGTGHFVLLSAICVQRPKLAFQKAKLAFERKLIDSGLRYSIVRPTAFFKSLSGQVARVQAGRPFLVFGDGTLTACKPISDRDLGVFLTRCLDDPTLQNAILPIGGPGPAITPREQGEMLFDLTGRRPQFRSLPIRVMDGVIGALRIGGLAVPSLRAKAELAKIGRYYATESMLVWTGSDYDADATPSFGEDTLRDHYRAMIRGEVAADLGDHAVF